MLMDELASMVVDDMAQDESWDAESSGVGILDCSPSELAGVVVELGLELASTPTCAAGPMDPFDVCAVCLELGQHCTCNVWTRPPEYNSADELERFMYHWPCCFSMMRAARHGALVSIGQALVYVQGIAHACYGYRWPTDRHRLFTALSVCSH